MGVARKAPPSGFLKATEKPAIGRPAMHMMSATKRAIQTSQPAMTISTGLRKARALVSSFGWTSAFTVQMRCTGSSDPSCTNQQPLPVLTVWSLSELLPGCTGSSQVAFMDPRQVVGSTVLTCPATPQLVGRIEEASWTLQGTD